MVDLTRDEIETRKKWWRAKLNSNASILAEDREFWTSEVALCDAALRGIDQEESGDPLQRDYSGPMGVFEGMEDQLRTILETVLYPELSTGVECAQSFYDGCAAYRNALLKAVRGIDQRESAATETPSVSGVVASNATRQSDSHQTPETDALWVALMDACKKSGVPPANADDTFALLDKFRSLEHRLRAAEAARDELQAHCNLLTGMKFSDRIHSALKERAEKAEAELRKRCECRFSAGGVQSKTCAFHERQLRAAKTTPDPLSQALNEGDGVYRP